MQTQTGRSRGRGGERASESAPVLWVDQAQDLDGGSLGTMAQVLVACKALAVADERKLDREGDGGGRLGAERAQEPEREREGVVGEGGGVLGQFGEALEWAGDEERSEGARSEAVLVALDDGWAKCSGSKAESRQRHFSSAQSSPPTLLGWCNGVEPVAVRLAFISWPRPLVQPRPLQRARR